ncbi:MAG TPA: helix-turn-helix transcriptional regulator [Planctomicrobium sp.]|nr:helix-turn-helix transcriptional regulator [Planctomicrobium sp.]
MRCKRAVLCLRELIEQRFGKAVRAAREKQGISQEAFAVQAGIHRTDVSSVELGKVQVNVRIAQQLADALGTPFSKLWKKIEAECPGPDLR